MPDAGITVEEYPAFCDHETVEEYENLKKFVYSLAYTMAFSDWLEAVRKNQCNGINSKLLWLGHDQKEILKEKRYIKNKLIIQLHEKQGRPGETYGQFSNRLEALYIEPHLEDVPIYRVAAGCAVEARDVYDDVQSTYLQVRQTEAYADWLQG